MSPYNTRKKFASRCTKKENLDLQISLGVDSAGIIYEKDSLSSMKEMRENYATEYLNKNLFHGLALAEDASTSLEPSSKPITILEFYASSRHGINIIVDLDASPSDLYKRMEIEIRDYYSTHNNKEFRSLRDEIEKRFSMTESDTEKLLKNGHRQVDSIKRDSCSATQFSGTVCQEKKAFCSPRVSTLKEVIPRLKLKKEYDESAPSRSGVYAEVQERVSLVGGAETSTKFHPIISIKRERPSSEYNLRSRTRSRQLAQRVLPRRSMRLVNSQ